jgi:hypothetical protein
MEEIIIPIEKLRIKIPKDNENVEDEDEDEYEYKYNLCNYIYYLYKIWIPRFFTIHKIF